MRMPAILSVCFCAFAAFLWSGQGIAHNRALSPSELNSNPSIYGGKQVLVIGYVILKPGGHILYESKNLHEEFRRRWQSDDATFKLKDYERYCLTIANPDLLYKYDRKFDGSTITIRGTFLSNYLDATHIDLGACPLPTAILVDEDDLRQRYGLK
jgi:hypothetical protein